MVRLYKSNLATHTLAGKHWRILQVDFLLGLSKPLAFHKLLEITQFFRKLLKSCSKTSKVAYCNENWAQKFLKKTIRQTLDVSFLKVFFFNVIRQKGETEGNLDEITEPEDAQKQTEQTGKTAETETIEGEGDEAATGQNSEQENKEKQATSEEDGNDNSIESSGTPNSANEKIEKETSEAEQGLDDEWKKKMEEAVLKLRSTLKENLVKLGIKPEGNKNSIVRGVSGIFVEVFGPTIG